MYHFLLGGGITIFESHSFPIFSMHCLYKIDLTFNFSKFNLFPSLLYYYRVFFFFYSLVFEPNIVHMYQHLVLPR